MCILEVYLFTVCGKTIHQPFVFQHEEQQVAPWLRVNMPPVHSTSCLAPFEMGHYKRTQNNSYNGQLTVLTLRSTSRLASLTMSYLFILYSYIFMFLCTQFCLTCSSPGGRDYVQHWPPRLSATGQGASG